MLRVNHAVLTVYSKLPFNCGWLGLPRLPPPTYPIPAFPTILSTRGNQRTNERTNLLIRPFPTASILFPSVRPFVQIPVNPHRNKRDQKRTEIGCEAEVVEVVVGIGPVMREQKQASWRDRCLLSPNSKAGCQACRATESVLVNLVGGCHSINAFSAFLTFWGHKWFLGDCICTALDIEANKHNWVVKRSWLMSRSLLFIVVKYSSEFLKIWVHLLLFHTRFETIYFRWDSLNFMESQCRN